MTSLKNLFELYNKNTDELEVKFGTKHANFISRTDFNNVMQKLKSSGFTIENPSGKYYLSIRNEFINNVGHVKISNIRTEIHFLNNIKKYCKENNFDFENPPSYVKFNQKQSKFIDDKRVESVDFDDFRFRVSLNKETKLSSSSRLVQRTLQEWRTTKKIYRLIKRFTFKHSMFPVKVDCSIVKSSRKKRNHLISEFTIEKSNIFNNLENFEIEIELLPKYNIENMDDVIKSIKKVIVLVLGGLQQTNYPVSYTEIRDIINKYKKLVGIKDKDKYKAAIKPSNFIGPSSISLEVINIKNIDTNSTVPNIREPYTVTDKADGQRKLLYISDNGKMYLIDTNMNVQFTGCVSENGRNSLIDGEHVLRDKNGKFINLFLAFDFYFKRGEDLRNIAFISTKSFNYDQTRLQELSSFLKELTITSKSALTISLKTFYTSEGKKIFYWCKEILNNEKKGLFKYNIDGLIFTPINTGVGTNKIGETPPSRKITWHNSFKWKPPEFNTIDFLATTQKTQNGDDIIGNLFESGEDMHSTRQILQYKTLILRVGFDERKHGFLNPCKDIIEDNIPTSHNIDENKGYRPVPFYPTDPTDNKASICNVFVEQSIYGNKYMLTENKEEVFEDNTIIECRYDASKEEGWRWIPIRVRHDKTSEYRRGLKNYGNAYHVAQSVWRSIHDPITVDMIITGKGVSSELKDDDIYYRKSGLTSTRALRDFHNLFVKHALIKAVSKPGNILIDLAVGKGGDMPKWIAAHLDFVFGIDVSRDNIENRLDGICARFIKYKKQYRSMPYGLFITGNSSQNLRNGDAAATTKGKEIINAILGKGPKDEIKLGKGVYKQYGKGKDGFDIVSCQFALHYFFENQDILQNFIRNVSENCKLGGYFIGTCYDGGEVFKKLEDIKMNESIVIMKEERKVWELTKKYDSDTFEDNETSVGYAIDIYQETINKTFREYLVNFVYLTQLMQTYGFELNFDEIPNENELPDTNGLFGDLFTFMEENVRKQNKRGYGAALKMTTEEKQISFLNRYFIFKKMRNVDTNKILIMKTIQTNAEVKKEEEESKQIKKKIIVKRRKKPKKLKKKIRIKQA